MLRMKPFLPCNALKLSYLYYSLIPERYPEMCQFWGVTYSTDSPGLIRQFCSVPLTGRNSRPLCVITTLALPPRPRWTAWELTEGLLWELSPPRREPGLSPQGLGQVPALLTARVSHLSDRLCPLVPAGLEVG